MNMIDDYLIDRAVTDVVKQAAPAAAAAKGMGELFRESLNRLPGKALEQGVGSVVSGLASGGTRHFVDKLTRPSLTQQMLGPHGMLRKALLLGGTAAGVAAGAEAAEDYFDKKRRGPAALRKSIGKLYAEFPEMAELPEKQVKQYMRTLQTFNPRAASDPLVAKGWVNKNLAFADEGIHPSDLELLSKSSRSPKQPSAVVRAFEDITRFAD